MTYVEIFQLEIKNKTSLCVKIMLVKFKIRHLLTCNSDWNNFRQKQFDLNDRKMFLAVKNYNWIIYGHVRTPDNRKKKNERTT
jgi:hypothetical protein